MALVFVEGFDGSSSATYFSRQGWSLFVGGGGGGFNGIGTTSGKFGTNGLVTSQYYGARGFNSTPTFKINVNDVKWSFWAKNGNAVGNDGTPNPKSYSFLNSMRNANSSLGILLTLDSNQRPVISRLDNLVGNFVPTFTVNTGATYPLADAQWHHYEMRFVASTTTTGLVQCWIDGQLVIDYQNVVTVNTSDAYASTANVMDLVYMTIAWPSSGGLYGDVNYYYDDLIIWDGLGSQMNTANILGPTRVRSLLPRANGTYNEFSGFANTGGNWNALRSFDDDSSFAQANNANQRSSFYFDFIPGNPTKIPAIAVRTMVKTADIGQKQYTLFIKNGTVEVNTKPNVFTTSIFYTFTPNISYPLVYYSNPNNNVAWTSTNWSNTELGITVEA